MKTWNEKIHYSQCWEDPVVLSGALDINSKDTILSVTSGGDNTLALLLRNPKNIVAIDASSPQNYLLELKMVAMKELEHTIFLEFIGVVPTKNRLKYFEVLKDGLSLEARRWWNYNLALIEKGIMHSGKFERYLEIFRKIVLPFAHSQKTIDRLFSLNSLSAQKSFYSFEWNTWRWRVIFKIFFSKLVMIRLGRNRLLFGHINSKNLGSYYLKKTGHFFMNTFVYDNYFLEYILKGTYKETVAMPPYMREENFTIIKNNLSKIIIVNNDLLTFLKKSKQNSYSKFNLSDIFESLSQSETNHVFEELVRVGRKGSIVAYWNNLVHRTFPKYLSSNIKDYVEDASFLHKKDRIFFYRNFNINKIIKQ